MYVFNYTQTIHDTEDTIQSIQSPLKEHVARGRLRGFLRPPPSSEFRSSSSPCSSRCWCYMASLRRTISSRLDFDPGMAPGSYRRKRRAVNCEECRRSKLRCDRQHPCGACKRRRREDSCTYEVIPEAPVSVKRRSTPVTTTGSAVSTSAPSQRLEESISETNRTAPGTHWEAVLQRPAPEQDAQDAQNIMLLSFSSRISLQELIDSLPPRGCCDYLVAHFFKHIYALFPILHAPTFQTQYMSFMQRPHDTDLSWLALLF